MTEQELERSWWYLQHKSKPQLLEHVRLYSILLIQDIWLEAKRNA